MRSSLTLCFLAASSALAGLPPEEQARRHLEQISAVLTPAPAKDLALSSPVLVAQAPGQIYQNALPPVWVVRVRNGPSDHGYLMWENTETAALLEFALEGKLLPCPEKGGITEGVPALQQFPVPGRTARTVASGCVPTAAASLIGYWTNHGFPQWNGSPALPEKSSVKNHALRLRQTLRMSEMPDTSGYTDDGLTLSGAYPHELAEVLAKDARAHGVSLKTEYSRFSFQTLKSETAAARPVLLSCMVRLPQKPHLSWGHEIIGVGWLELENQQFVGVEDNFYPTESSDTVRWIRREAFESLITVSPETRERTGRSEGGNAPPDKKQTH